MLNIELTNIRSVCISVRLEPPTSSLQEAYRQSIHIGASGRLPLTVSCPTPGIRFTMIRMLSLKSAGKEN
jgi:predicted component of type VI protein secretion system